MFWVLKIIKKSGFVFCKEWKASIPSFARDNSQASAEHDAAHSGCFGTTIRGEWSDLIMALQPSRLSEDRLPFDTLHDRCVSLDERPCWMANELVKNRIFQRMQSTSQSRIRKSPETTMCGRADRPLLERTRSVLLSKTWPFRSRKEFQIVETFYNILLLSFFLFCCFQFYFFIFLFSIFIFIIFTFPLLRCKWQPLKWMHWVHSAFSQRHEMAIAQQIVLRPKLLNIFCLKNFHYGSSGHG